LVGRLLLHWQLVDAPVIAEGQELFVIQLIVVFLEPILAECNLKCFHDPLCVPHEELQYGRVPSCLVLFAEPEIYAIEGLFLEVNVLHDARHTQDLLQLPDEGHRHINLWALWA
jgi:hypothetical protein